MSNVENEKNEKDGTVDLGKLRSISANIKAKGTSKRVVKDDHGSHEVHHWDDRVDAVVNAKSINATVKVK